MQMNPIFHRILAMLLVLAGLLTMVPTVFATNETEEQDTDNITINVDDLISDSEDEEFDEDESEYEYTIPELEALLDGSEEEGYDGDGNDIPDKRDVRNTNYVFLDFKVGSASRNFNWQVKSSGSTDQYFAANRQGLIAAYFSGDDPRLYMPVETHSSGLERLGSYVLQSGDIIQVHIYETSASDYFTSGGTGTYNSGFALRNSLDNDAWDWVGSTSIKRNLDAQTLQWNVPSDQVGSTLYGVRWDPIQPTDAQKGTITKETRFYVDYIYVGPKSNAPVNVGYYGTDSKLLAKQANGYVGKGQKAMAWDHGKKDSEDSTSQTIWGWAVHQQIDGVWTDMNQFITDPSTFVCNYNTRFYLKQVKIRKADLNSTQVYDNGVSTADDNYVLTVDGFDTAEINLGRYGKPLDITLVLDRSGSMAQLVASKTTCTTIDAVNTKLDALDKRKWPGYYRATFWRRDKSDGGSGAASYQYTMPLRYYRGAWQMQVVTEDCNCNAGYHASYGIYDFNSTGLNPCSHVEWVAMSTAFNLYVKYRNRAGYSTGMTIGISRLGRVQLAIEELLQDLYDSRVNLEPGAEHTVSLLSYGQSVYAEYYPFIDGNNIYRSNAGRTINKCKTSVVWDHNNYESLLKVLRDTYVYGPTRTDCAMQVLSGTVSALESGNDQSKTTLTKTDYLPAKDSKRNRVVVLLTDGCPTSKVDFDNNIATKAIAASKVIKGDGVTVYAVGIMNDLNAATYYTSSYATGTEAQKANNFLNLVSSRYKNASAYNTAGSKTSGDYFLASTAAGGDISDKVASVWKATQPSITPTDKSGVASLWLYEEFGREWKPDPNRPVKIYAAPHTGNGTFGNKVQIGEHKVTSGSIKQSYNGNGYVLMIDPFDDQRFSVTLKWTDAKKSFLRETSINLGSKAKAMSGTLDTSKGYKVFMEIPLEVDRNNTLGGNNIPLTKSTSGCYKANGTADTAKGGKLYDYATPNANVFCSVGAEAHDYFISMEDYIALMQSNSSSKLKDTLSMMSRLPETFRVVNDHKLSNLDYVSFDIQLLTSTGTELYHMAAANKATSLTSNVYNIKDSLVSLATDQTFKLVAKLDNVYNNTDSFGRAPYPDVNTTLYPTYYAPKFAVVDFDGKVSIPMNLESDASKMAGTAKSLYNSTDKVMTYDFGTSMISGNYAKIPYTYTATNTPLNPATGEVISSNVINRDLYIISANVITYDDTFLNFQGAATLEGDKRVAWSTAGTRKDLTQTFNNSTVHGYDAAYATTGDLHSASRVASVTTGASTAVATTTISGTGFEIISRTTPDSGVMIVEVYEGNAVNASKLKASILCNTYLSNASYYQVPVVRWNAEQYGTYTIQITAYYHPLFALKASATEEFFRAELGYDESVDFTYIPSVTAENEFRELRTGYNVYVDGIRIYNPAQSDIVTDYTYGLANESIANFQNLRDIIVDATTWTGGGANGLLYMADENANAEFGDEIVTSETGFPLGMEDGVTIERDTASGLIYYLKADGTRLQHPKTKKDIFSYFDDKGAMRYGYENPDANTASAKPIITVSRAYVRELLGSHFYFYNKAYKNYGPNGEIYLKQNSGVAFAISGNDLSLSLKSADGKACKVQVWNGSAWVDYKDPVTQSTTLASLTTNCEMYYDFSSYVTGGKVIIRNAGTGVLSLVHARAIGIKSVTVNEEVALEACKAFEMEEIVTVVDGMKIGHSLDLQSNIGVNYIIAKSAVEGYDDFYLHCTVAGKIYKPTAVVKGELIYFTLDQLSATEMNENITTTLYMYKGEEVYRTVVDHYSIAAYAYSMLNKDNVSQEVKTLCANLLRYGSVAQLYKDYATDALADEELSYEHSLLLTDLDTVEFANNYALLGDVADATVSWIGKSLILDSTVAVKLAIDASAFAGNTEELSIRVSYTDVDGEEQQVTLTGPEAYSADRGLYIFVLDFLQAADLRTVLSCAIYDGETQVSETMTYSADTYGNGKTGDLLTLCKALIAYADSAKAVFAG